MIKNFIARRIFIAAATLGLLGCPNSTNHSTGDASNQSSTARESAPTSTAIASSTATATAATKPGDATQAIAKLFAGNGPSKTSVLLPAISLGMKAADAQALWKKDKAKFKTTYFELGWTASNKKTVDFIRYNKLPKDGLLEIADKTWGKAKLDPVAANPKRKFPFDRHCWFNSKDGVRACARYLKQMKWTELTISHYLAAESFIKDGQFVFERGSSLIGKNADELRTQLLRFDEWPHHKDAHIPGTAFNDGTKLSFVFAKDGKVTSMSFGLDFVDADHRDRLLAGLATGLGAGKKSGSEWKCSIEALASHEVLLRSGRGATGNGPCDTYKWTHTKAGRAIVVETEDLSDMPSGGVFRITVK